MVIVSACLAGLKTRYDGTENRAEKIFDGSLLIPVCPEQLGGLPTPRPPAEITDGDGTNVIEGRARVKDCNGKDVTVEFLRGAGETLKAAKIVGAVAAYLKEKSPSCGVKTITKDGAEIKGKGVLTALLQREGLHVKGF